MTIDSIVGIIGGNGWLGSAIANAAIAGSVIVPDRLIVSGRSDKRGVADVAGVQWTRDNRELAASSDIIVLSVRPEQFAAINIDARDRLVVSVMAGITAETIAQQTSAAEVVRAIPSAAAAIGKSFTPWFATTAVSAGNRQLVQTLFESCGEAAEVPQESHIDYCVAMTGSGAAFPALLAEAMIAHAVEQGLPRDFAERAARSVVADASQLFAGVEGNTADIVQAMIDYRGATGAGLQAMLDHGFNAAVAAGLEAASR